MFRIYTKEKNSIELFNINLNAKEVESLMENNLFLDHPNINPDDCVIIQQEEPLKNPTYRDNELREMTREELIEAGIEVSLEPGEKIINRKIIKIAQPTFYHQWNGDEWSVNLEEIKELTRNKFKNEFNTRRYSNFEYEGNLYQMGQTDIPNFEKIKMALDILERYTDINEILHLLEYLDKKLVMAVREQLKVNPNLTSKELLKLIEAYPTDWRLVDNSTVQITYRKVLDILVAWIFRDGAFNNIYNKINEKISRANSVEELQEIKWE